MRTEEGVDHALQGKAEAQAEEQEDEAMTFCWKDIPPFTVDGPPKVQLRRWIGIAWRWRGPSAFGRTIHCFLYALFFMVGVRWFAGRLTFHLSLWPRFDGADGDNLFRWRVLPRLERIPCLDLTLPCAMISASPTTGQYKVHVYKP